MPSYPILTIRDLAEIAQGRLNNELDFLCAFVGPRGSGKSTAGYKLAYDIGDFPTKKVDEEGKPITGGKFDPERDMVYDRKELNDLLKKRKFRIAFADELIRSGYNRNWQDKDQKELVIMLNMYRNNFNVLIGAIPMFYDLDSDLRNLFFMRVDIISRGIGLVHIQKKSLFQNDPWDTAYNKKIEEEWKKSKSTHHNWKKLSTFVGILQWGELDPRQKIKYERIRDAKKAKIDDGGGEMNKTEKKMSTFIDNCLQAAHDGKLTTAEFDRMVDMNSYVRSTLLDIASRTVRDKYRDKGYDTLARMMKKNDKKMILVHKGHLSAQSGQDRSNNLSSPEVGVENRKAYKLPPLAF